MTPEEGASPAQSPQVVAERMREALESAKERRQRRSSVRGVNSAINDAMKMATERRRRSMAEASKNDQIGEQMREAMRSAQIRHRKSISKAADVLECAGYDE